MISSFVFCCVLILNTQANVMLDLNSPSHRWMVQDANQTFQPFNATVPGGIYSDLIAAGILNESLFRGNNDVAYRWVGYTDWIYSLNFSVSKEDFSKENNILTLNGIDTISSVYLNHVYLGNTTNMFVQYTFNVKRLLWYDNNLKIKIYSPIRAAKMYSKSLPHGSPPQCTPPQYNGECHVNVIRKMQASFAWDWGPAFPSMGIWKPIQINLFNDIYLERVNVLLNEETNDWEITIRAHVKANMSLLEIARRQDITLGAKIYLPYVIENYVPIYPTTIERDPFEENLFLVHRVIKLRKGRVRLWWPNGHGDQTMYYMEVNLNTLHSIQKRQIHVGFRTIKVIQDPVSNGKGLTFYFSVNGIPIFAKGSNYIPADVLPEGSYNYTKVDHLLLSAKKANMNMIRVWGGGLYESDRFYELCDKYGIMVWQDMMFACATYPVTRNFLNSVKIEINQQIRRLQSHPSIAIWAGNNENEVALRQNWYSTNTNPTMYFNEYRTLYVDTIQTIIESLDPTREYVTSSPSNGLNTKEQNYIASNPYDPLYGDIHNYNYLINSWSSKSFPIPRFCSEYGFQSLPSFTSLKAVSKGDDLRNLSTPFMNHRQHLPGGNMYLLLVDRQMTLPCPDGCLDTFAYYTQINQAWSIKTETEVYRRHRSILYEDGKGLTMGALYWQLNDVWQAPSWSSIEFKGRWKMLHYYAVKFFAPYLISPDLTDDESKLRIYLVNDQAYDLPNVMINVYIYRYDIFQPVKTLYRPYTLEKLSSKITWDIDVKEIMPEKDLAQYLVRTTLTHLYNRSIINENFLFPSSLKKAEKYLKPANVTVDKIQQLSPDEFYITLRSTSIALFVWLDLDTVDIDETQLFFSENGFHMLSPMYHVTCTTKITSVAELAKYLKVRAFYSIQNNTTPTGTEQ